MKQLLIPTLVFLFACPAFALDVKFEEDSDAVPLVYLNVAVKTGSVSDPADQLGMTNFMGEMLLRGTKSRSKEELDLAIDQLGATLEVETRAESMIFRGAVLSSELPEFLEILHEILTRPSFPETEIKKLRSQMIAGILQERSADNVLASKHFHEFLFVGHPYGKPILGKVRDVEKFTADKIRAHYGRLIREKLLLVVGTGRADNKVITEWAQKVAEDRAGGDETFRKVPTPQPKERRRLLIVDKPDRTQVQIYGGQIGVRMTDEGFFPLHIANHAFGGGSFSSRLMQEIRKERGWSYGAYSGFRHGTEPRLWQFHLFPASKYAPEALGHVISMIEKFKKQGLSVQEFTQAKNALIRSAGFLYSTPKKRVENILLEQTLELPDGFIRSFADKMAGVSLDETNAAVKEFVHPDRLSITILATSKNLKEKLARAAGVPVKEVKVVPYTEE